MAASRSMRPTRVHVRALCTEAERLRRLLSASEARVAQGDEVFRSQLNEFVSLIRDVNVEAVKRSESVESFALHHAGRLDALAQVQRMLTEGGKGEADLADMVWNELAAVICGPEDEARIIIDGPSVALDHITAGPVAIALHELTSNAIKFGALANDGGTIRVKWRVVLAAWPEVNLRWTETAIDPLPDSPERTGFGRYFLEKDLPRRLGATTTLEITPVGLNCELTFPCAENADERPEPAPAFTQDSVAYARAA